MRRLTLPLVLAPALLVGCATKRPADAPQATLAELRQVEPDVEDVKIEQGLDQAMEGYRRFLEETPETAMTPEAMRRLADLQLENQFGIRGGDGNSREMAVPESAAAQAEDLQPPDSLAAAGPRESDQEFEQRTTSGSAESSDGGGGDGSAAALDAIALYDKLLAEYPSYENSDQVLYQKARAYDELGRTEEAMETMERMIAANPHSEHYDEVQFRRAEFFFTRRKFRDAESAYSTVISMGPRSSYYEMALYKLGWTLYKQEFYEEALQKYVALLDYKVSVGYDFDQTNAEEDERRVADTYRAISLSFTNYGGTDAVDEYFATFGNRSYEDRVYSHLGEHYLAKLRYDDAAKTYKAFVALYPFHREAPQFSMHVVDTFTQGGFPKLVLESKREFASKYGLQSEYWRHFVPAESPEVLAYLKSNLKDLATHYHAAYQGAEIEDEKGASYLEARRWYGDYLESFPADTEAPQINYRLADLLFEQQDFGEAAKQYERTAYDYEPHEQSAAAGYAAVYAYREQLRSAAEDRQGSVKRDTVVSSLRFADTFPDHESTAMVLGAAADDLYEMKEYGPAIESAQRVIDTYPEAEESIRRSAWVVVAHGSFELTGYPQAEQAYTQVLTLTPRDDETHASFVDNLAASIYKQGELANEAQDYQAAADHFLRIRSAAPASTIRSTAEYDAGAALVRLENWTAAARVFEGFRQAYPEHELQLDATRQIAYAYRQNGELSRAAGEYSRFANESEDPEMRSEALLVAGDLYQQSGAPERALDVYGHYVDEFPEPTELALETRVKIAEIHKAANDEALYHEQLAMIVRVDAEAGEQRSIRTRTIAARSALVLAERAYDDFVEVRLQQPFDVSLKDKQGRMDETIEAMGRLVDYEIADVTAAATFYMAETYFDFSRSLAESERPTDLQPADMAEYELVLEEEAFPFEERAIDVHEKNLEMLQAGAFNEWTEKSLGKLAELVPGRYAKNELSIGFIDTIERYTYHWPAFDISAPTASEPVQTASVASGGALGEGMVKDENPQ